MERTKGITTLRHSAAAVESVPYTRKPDFYNIGTCYHSTDVGSDPYDNCYVVDNDYNELDRITQPEDKGYRKLELCISNNLETSYIPCYIREENYQEIVKGIKRSRGEEPYVRYDPARRSKFVVR
jgi:hypothetical protein